LALTSKKESLELAPQWKQRFAPSTNNIWLDYVRRVSATAITHVYKDECALFLTKHRPIQNSSEIAEIAPMLVRFDHVARCIANANHASCVLGEDLHEN